MLPSKARARIGLGVGGLTIGLFGLGVVGNGCTSTNAPPESLACGKSYPTDAKPYGLAAADFNGDGVRDIVVATEKSVSVALLETAGSDSSVPEAGAAITLASGPDGGGGYQAVATGDLDRDGHPDIVYGTPTGIVVAFNKLATTGEFLPIPLSTVTGQITAIDLLDLNGDGYLDITAGDATGNVYGAVSASGTFKTLSSVGSCTQGVSYIDEVFEQFGAFRAIFTVAVCAGGDNVEVQFRNDALAGQVTTDPYKSVRAKLGQGFKIFGQADSDSLVAASIQSDDNSWNGSVPTSGPSTGIDVDEPSEKVAGAWGSTVAVLAPVRISMASDVIGAVTMLQSAATSPSFVAIQFADADKNLVFGLDQANSQVEVLCQPVSVPASDASVDATLPPFSFDGSIPADAPSESSTDAASDAVAPVDGGADAALDAPADVSLDAPADASTDSSAEASADAGSPWTFTDVDPSRPLNAVWGSSASDVYAVGVQGAAYHSGDKGATWQPVTIGSDQLFGIWGTGADNVYVVSGAGATGNIYRGTPSGDGGPLTWTSVDTAPEGLFAVWGSGANDVYVGGVGGAILHATDGVTFTAQTSGTAADILAIWGSGPSDVYAVGTVNGPGPAVILHSTGNGQWQTVDTLGADGGPGPVFASVWGPSANAVYVSDTTDNRLLVSTSQGTTWSSAASLAGGGGLYGIWGSSAKDIYVVGGTSTGPLLAHYGGSGSLVPETLPPGGQPGDGFTGVWGSSATDVYAVGAGGGGMTGRIAHKQ